MPLEQQDPYAPPPRHRERNGAVVRFAILAALLGAAGWGYMEYSSQPQTALVPTAEERLADTSYDSPPAAPDSTTEPQTTTPAQTPERAPDQPPA